MAVLGGAKVAEKIGVVEHFLEHADSLLIGGAMSLPFLAVQGHPPARAPAKSTTCMLPAVP